MTAYPKSKTLAEKAAWDYIDDLKKNGEFAPELVTINPGFIIGPTKINTGFSSGEVMRKMLMGKLPVVSIKMPCVTVDECAQAHVLAIKNPKAANNRFILVNKCLWFREIGQSLHKEF